MQPTWSFALYDGQSILPGPSPSTSAVDGGVMESTESINDHGGRLKKSVFGPFVDGDPVRAIPLSSMESSSYSERSSEAIVGASLADRDAVEDSAHPPKDTSSLFVEDNRHEVQQDASDQVIARSVCEQASSEPSDAAMSSPATGAASVVKQARRNRREEDPMERLNAMTRNIKVVDLRLPSADRTNTAASAVARKGATVTNVHSPDANPDSGHLVDRQSCPSDRLVSGSNSMEDVLQNNGRQYDFRKNNQRTISEILKTTQGGLFCDPDASGTFDPNDRQEPEVIANREPERVRESKKRGSDSGQESPKPKRAKVIMSTHLKTLRQRGEQMPIKLVLNSDEGRKLLQAARDKRDGHDNWPLEWQTDETSESAESPEQLSRTRPRNKATEKVQDSDDSLAKRLEHIVLGDPKARGCKFCVMTPDGEDMCSLVNGGTYPCNRCCDEDEECEPILEPLLKTRCNSCAKVRALASTCEFRKHPKKRGPCSHCAQKGFKCIAGPRRDANMSRLSLSGERASRPAPKTSRVQGPNNRALPTRGFHERDKRPVHTAAHTTQSPNSPLDDDSLFVPMSSGPPPHTPLTLPQLRGNSSRGDENGARPPKNIRFAPKQRFFNYLGQKTQPPARRKNGRKRAAWLTPRALNVQTELLGGGSSSESENDDGDIDMGEASSFWAPSSAAAREHQRGRREYVLPQHDIRTRLSYPLKLNTSEEDCSWCTITLYAWLGTNRIRDIRVRVHPNGIYQEIWNDGQVLPRSQMCKKCTEQRERVVRCPSHLMRPLNEDRIDRTALKHALIASAGKEHLADLPILCCICFNAATYKCQGMSGVKCGLALCDACTDGMMEHGQDLEDFINSTNMGTEEDDWMSLRADACMFRHVRCLLGIVAEEPE